MRARMCVCMRARMCVYICDIYMHMCVHMNLYADPWDETIEPTLHVSWAKRGGLHATYYTSASSSHVRVPVCLHVAQAHIHTSTRVYTYTFIDVYTYICMCVHMSTIRIY